LAPDGIAEPALARMEQLQAYIARLAAATELDPIHVQNWLRSGYQPTPTIVQVAQALYHNHAVGEIARSDVSAQHRSHTTERISSIIDRAKVEVRKSVCFVTGVPGADKTLAGLNIATERAQEHDDEHAVFVSGNGPLVTVVREALARDEAAREGTTKTN